MQARHYFTTTDTLIGTSKKKKENESTVTCGLLL